MSKSKPYIYAFGSNSSGQLGIGHEEDTFIPTRCIFEDEDEYEYEEESEEDIKATTMTTTAKGECENENSMPIQIATGGNHTIILFNGGYNHGYGYGNGKGEEQRVYTAGYNKDGRCGIPIPISRVKVRLNENENENEIGSNQEEQEQREQEEQPKDSDSDGSTSLLRFRRVTLGLGGKTSTKTKHNPPIKLISATWEASFFVVMSSSDSSCITDKIYVTGTGLKGELGLGSSQHHCPYPHPIPDFPPPSSSSSYSHINTTSKENKPTPTTIKAISSGMSHTVVVLSNGTIYGWGASRKGQLGPILKERKFVYTPSRIDGVDFPVLNVSCGREFTVLYGDRNLVILGSIDNRWGLFSKIGGGGDLFSGIRIIKEKEMESMLKLQFSIGFNSISSSWNGVYVHLDDERVVAWGRDDRGQIPHDGSLLWKMIAVGSEHGLGLLDDEKTVLAFGWGEHGNCGAESDERGDVKGRCNVVMSPGMLGGSKVIGLAAGCATSWIVVL